jgi:hypothetical protein
MASSKRFKADGFGSGGDLVPIDQLQAAIASVGRVCLPSWVGSCCLVSLPNLKKRKDRRVCILTNEHVIPTKDVAGKARIDFEEIDRDLKTSVLHVRLDPDDFFVSNKELDFALVAIDLSSAGKKVLEAVLDLRQTVDIGVNDVINIVQHPSGGSKKISSQCVIVSQGDVFECAADVLPGSSGSPVFSNWQLAGIIHAVRKDTRASVCTSMRAILKSLGAEVRPEEFLDKHRTLFRPNLATWEWVSSPSQFQPVDLCLPPAKSGNQECVLLLAVPKGSLRLRTSSDEAQFPKLQDEICKKVEGTAVLVTKERVVTLTSGANSTVLFRLNVLQVSLLVIPISGGIRASFGDTGSFGKEWFCIRNCKGLHLQLELRLTSSGTNGRPSCYISLHSKDDLILTEETEKSSHQEKLHDNGTSTLILHAERDTIFVQVFWLSNSVPKFELTARSFVAMMRAENHCTLPNCTICTKTGKFRTTEKPALATLFLEPLVGSVYSLQIQRLSGNAFLPSSVLWNNQLPLPIQWGNVQTDHSFRVVRKCLLLTAHSNSPCYVKTLRKEQMVNYALESPESVLQFYKREVIIQSAANALALEWNRHLGCAGLSSSNFISFIEVAVFWLDNRKEFGLIEHVISGDVRKFSDASGNALLGDESNAAQAFSHFTVCATNGRILVCNIQGCKTQFTHPVIHTNGDQDLQHFSHPQNQSINGIRDFFASHRCNTICTQLKLTIPTILPVKK